MTVDHNKRVLHCTDGHPGARNDKSIVGFDKFIMGLKNREILADFPFTLRSAEGCDVQMRGAYVITYGWYHLWRCCQPPIKLAWRQQEVVYSCRLESVRKNVS